MRHNSKRMTMGMRVRNFRSFNDIKAMYGSMISDFKNSDIYKQITPFYSIVLILVLAALIGIKIYMVNEVLQNQSNTTYYQSEVLNLLDKQRNMKMMLDKTNNNNYMRMHSSSINFLKIYTQELNNKNYTNIDFYNAIGNQNYSVPYTIDSWTQNTNRLFTGLSKTKSPATLNFSALYNFQSVLKPANAIDDGDLNLDLFTPIMYLFSPLLYQNLYFSGLYLSSFYFLGYSYDNVNNICNNGTSGLMNNVYFKYPVENLEVSASYSNGAIYDTILDPVGTCYVNSFYNTANIKNSNWYYNYEKSMLSTNQTQQRLIDYLQLNSDQQKSDYTVSYVSFPIKSRSGATYYMTFAQKNYRSQSIQPYLILPGDNTNEQPFDYYSEVNLPLQTPDMTTNYTRVNLTKSPSLYYQTYNLDDNKFLIYNIPKFISNMYKYGMLPKVVVNNTSSINVQSLILTNDQVNNIITSQYSINYYFGIDSVFYQLAQFLRRYFNYRGYELTYVNNILKQNANYTLINNTADIDRTIVGQTPSTQKFHRCLYSNLTYYENLIKSQYDCIKYQCFYTGNCSARNSSWNYEVQERYMPYCYCLPMYCYDEYTSVKDIPANYLSFYENNFTFYNNKNYGNDIIQCRLSIVRKDQTLTPALYKVAIHQDYIDMFFNTTSFIIYMIEENTIVDNVMNVISNNLYYVKVAVCSFYALFVVICIKIFYNIMGNKIKALESRIDNIQQIHLKIILNSQQQLVVSSLPDNEEANLLTNKQLEGNIIDVEAGYLKDPMDEYIMDIKEDSSRDEKDDNNNFPVINVNRNIEELNSKTMNSPVLKAARENGTQIGIKPLKRKTLFKDNKEKGVDNTNRFRDELHDIVHIVHDNIQDFNLDFNIDKNMYGDNKLIKKFCEFIKKDYYRELCLPKNTKPYEKPRSFNINSSSSSSIDAAEQISRSISSELSIEEDKSRHFTDISMEDNDSNISLNILYELMSAETVDFESYRHNFYFREPTQKPILNLYKLIECYLYNEQTHSNEICDPEKLNTAILYNQYEIESRWRKKYEELMSKDKI